MQLNMAELAIETGFINDTELPGTPYLCLFNYSLIRKFHQIFRVSEHQEQESNAIILQRLSEARSFLGVVRIVGTQVPRTSDPARTSPGQASTWWLREPPSPGPATREMFGPVTSCGEPALPFIGVLLWLPLSIWRGQPSSSSLVPPSSPCF